MTRLHLLLPFVSLGLLASPAVSAEKTVSNREAQQIAKEAYVYGVPMVTAPGRFFFKEPQPKAFANVQDVLGGDSNRRRIHVRLQLTCGRDASR